MQSIMHTITSTAIFVMICDVIMASSPSRGSRSDQFLQKEQTDEGNQPRLFEILRMKEPLPLSMPPSSYMDGLPDYDFVQDAGPIPTSGVDDVVPTTKRVFCNMMTGCGGRFRTGRDMTFDSFKRRFLAGPHNARPEKRSFQKRPFCNTIGCFNGKKRAAASDFPLNLSKLTKLASELSAAPSYSELNSVESPKSSSSRRKRPFCNTYGGCFRFNKRSSSLTQKERTETVPFESSVDKEQPTNKIPFGSSDNQGERINTIPFPLSQESLETLSQMKRFFAGGYDSDMQSLIDSLKR